MHLLRACAVLVALAAVAVTGATASAATKTVTMGPPKALQKAFKRGDLPADVNAFFPNRVVIHVGDKVRFVPMGFHTTDLPGPGDEPLPVFAPNGQLVSGAVDAAGNPFWFNGQPQLGNPPELLQLAWGKTVGYDGSRRAESGLPVGNKLKPFVVRFDKAGRYTYWCDVHNGMKGVVVVRPDGAKIPPRRADARRAAAQAARALKIARGLPAATPPSGTVDVGEAGPQGVEYLDMLPKTVEVPVGGTLRFRMSQGSREVHTATFGPGNPLQDPSSYLGQIAASLESPSPDPRALYPSDPPPMPVALSPALHGNGFWNSGTLDLNGDTPPPPEATLQFSTPGTYDYYCLIHPFMHGTVVVR
ncbi:MAG TPA: hypothetical protein VFR97_13670 [Capillimicrobium sp.]|nr:hypothetical protein [Capillimicrobium sp.]